MGSESRFLEYIPAQSIRYGYKKNIKNSVPDPDFFTFDLRISYIIGVGKKTLSRSGSKFGLDLDQSFLDPVLLPY